MCDWRTTAPARLWASSPHGTSAIIYSPRNINLPIKVVINPKGKRPGARETMTGGGYTEVPATNGQQRPFHGTDSADGPSSWLSAISPSRKWASVRINLDCATGCFRATLLGAPIPMASLPPNAERLPVRESDLPVLLPEISGLYSQGNRLAIGRTVPEL